MKKAKLNELRGDSRKAEADIAKIRDDDTDAQRLTPDGCVVENNYIQVRRGVSTALPAAAWQAAAGQAAIARVCPAEWQLGQRFSPGVQHTNTLRGRPASGCSSDQRMICCKHNQ